MWEGWIIFVVGAHGSGKTSVSCELQRRLRILLNPLCVKVSLIEVSDVVRDWQLLEGRVDSEAIYTTEIVSAKLHEFLWDRLKLFRREVVICCGAREKHLLKPPSCAIVRIASIALTCSFEMRRQRFFIREQDNLLNGQAELEKNKDIKKRWDRSEIRETELNLGDVMSNCDSSFSTTALSVSQIVDWLLSNLLVNLWRSI